MRVCLVPKTQITLAVIVVILTKLNEHNKFLLIKIVNKMTF